MACFGGTVLATQGYVQENRFPGAHFMKKFLAIAAAGSAIVAAATSAHAATVLTQSFETPSLGTGSGAYAYGSQPFGGSPTVPSADLSGSGAQFLGASGIAADGSAFGFSKAPDGKQVAFIQSYNGTGGTIAQFFDTVVGQAYHVTFDAAVRPFSTGTNPIIVSSFEKDSTPLTVTSTAWTQYTFDFVSTQVANGIGFYGSALPGDSTVGIDAVTVTTVPEPASWAMMLAGFGLVGFAMRRRQRETRIRFAF
jgi:hypothetical protein